MKHIYITLPEEELIELRKAKGKMTWKELLWAGTKNSDAQKIREVMDFVKSIVGGEANATDLL